MEGTRLRILELLQKNSHDTVGGLATAMGLAPATVRRHLDILQRDRMVAFEEVRKKTGRPEYSFFLTEEGQEAMPKGYDHLLRLLVEELGVLTSGDLTGLAGQDVLEVVFSRLPAKLGMDNAATAESDNIDDRKDALLDVLQTEDFVPEANIVYGKLQIRLQNCPFRSVAMANTTVCDFDAAVINASIGQEMTRIECIHDGDPACVYVQAD